MSEDGNYETWKNEVSIWRLMTDISEEKQALAVTLSLQGQARSKGLEIPSEKLNHKNGMKDLLGALDSIFGGDKIDIAYSAYSRFDGYRRSKESIVDYIIEFEHRHNLCKQHEMALPDSVLAFKLLDGAGLDKRERQLVLTAVAADLKFQTMKSALKRIFADCGNQGDAVAGYSPGINFKQESAMYASQTGGAGRSNQYQNQRMRSNFRNHQQNSKVSAPKGTNPLDKLGRRTRCAICGSVFHWVKDCEHKDKGDNVKMTNDMEDCNLALFTEEDSSVVFMSEALGSAVLDTACTRTVCGRKWLSSYIDLLSSKEKSEVVEIPSNRQFKFGDGRQVSSEKNVTIPAVIAGKPCKISTEVVDADLPLLLSKESLKKAEAVLNLKDDKAMMFGKPVDLEYTSTGHYCVSLTDQVLEENLVDQVMVIDSDDVNEQKKIMEKLHRQFGHASSERLEKLLKNAGIKKPELFKILNETVSRCEICQRFRKTPSRPAVGLPMATDFNETVAADLHQLEHSVWLLHMIDMFTRYSAGVIIRSKQSSVFVDSFLSHWVGIFGAPKRFFSDNGGEFENEEVRQMGQNLGIEIITTAAYSPWSNGVCERHNLTLSEMVYKVREEKNCKWEVALSWALMAKNSLVNVHGYSAQQLVFGVNPNLPSTLSDELPALEGTTSSRTVGTHIASLYAARKAFTEAECSERIRRALKKQVRTSREISYELGDRVFYKRPDGNEWRGPGKVIGQDGVVVFVRHGGQLVRVHVCRLRKVKDETTTLTRTEQSVDPEATKVEKNFPGHAGGEDMEEENQHANIEDQQIEGHEVTEEQNENIPNQVQLPNQAQPKVKPGRVITFRIGDEEEMHAATVINRAGKATGKHRNWFNVRYHNTGNDVVEQSVDLEQLKDLKVLDIDEQADTDDVMVVNEVSFDAAKEAELKSWEKHKVFEAVQDVGQKAISTRWICTLKEKEGTVVPKARLVARGFEEIDQDLEKDSPTCSSESLKVILAVIAQHEWEPKSMDVKTAFLQGHPLERKVYLKPPKDAKVNGKLWLLKKCVYGLNDASLKWYNRVKEVMLKSGAQMSKVDPALFFWNDDHGRLRGVLGCHVDDFIWGGDETFENEIIDTIRTEFIIGREEKGSFSFVGMEVTLCEGRIYLDQHRYTENMKSMEIKKERCLNLDGMATEKEKTEMRSKVGQILWVARQTRPDVAFDGSTLAGRIKNATVKDLMETNKVIKRIKTDKVSLMFQKLHEKRTLVLYSDASLGNLPEGGSQGGHFVYLKDEEGKLVPLLWSSKKIRRVARSTLACETLALADGIDACLFLSTLLAELDFGKSDPIYFPITCFIDCKSLHEAVNSTKDVQEKRLRLDIYGIKEQLRNKQIQQVEWIPSSDQYADSLTKHGASSTKLLSAIEKGSA